MACSAKQRESNQKNSQKSTGPKTEEGKARSRANSLKHGLTGAGVVLAVEDAPEIARRCESLEADLAPKNELARRHLARAAFLDLRLERCARHEAKAIDYRMRQAEAAFDDERLAEVEKALSWIAAEPATHARRLRSSPEGLTRLIERLEGLKKDLRRPWDVLWTYQHCNDLHHLLGLRRVDLPASRARCLGEAVYGTLDLLSPDDGAGLPTHERRIWAADRLAELIEAEVAKLEALKSAIDVEAIALDRAEAPIRAMFDPSKEAILARKYEAAAERAYYKAMNGFEGAQKLPPQVAEEQQFDPIPGDDLGSFCPPDFEADHAEEMVDGIAPETVPMVFPAAGSIPDLAGFEAATAPDPAS
jgi:hypothetical protein